MSLARLTTATLLAVSSTLVILFAPTWLVGAALGLFVALGAWEWARLVGYGVPWIRGAFVVTVSGLGGVALWAGEMQGQQFLLLAASGWWLWTAFRLGRRAGSPGCRGETLGTRASILALAVGVMVLVPPWVALTTYHGLVPAGPQWVLYGLALVWIADSAAYLVGHALGRTPLAPRLSPNKTREGFLGGVVACLIWAVGSALWLVDPARLPAVIGISLLAVGFSLVGDLFESKLKRQAGLKDSGNLLPGHGGILDRIDSTTAAMPVFFLGASAMGVTG